jgi:hypothetical protein
MIRLIPADQQANAWTIGSDLALALIEDAHEVGQAASLEQTTGFRDSKVTEAFAAVLSEYISSRENGGVPEVEFLRKIAASAPGPGTGQMAEGGGARAP